MKWLLRYYNLHLGLFSLISEKQDEFKYRKYGNCSQSVVFFCHSFYTSPQKYCRQKNKFKLLKYLISIKIYTHNSQTKFREKKKVWFNKTQWDRRVCHLILFRVSRQYIFGSILPQNETMLTGKVDNDALTSVCFTVVK
jgi:hypothetical protein